MNSLRAEPIGRGIRPEQRVHVILADQVLVAENERPGAPRIDKLVARALARADFHCDALDSKSSHIGTTKLFRQMMTEETDLSQLYASHARLGSESARNVRSSGVVLDSVLG